MNLEAIGAVVGDVLGFALALYGAILSTILARRERQKDRRRLRVILEHVAFEEWPYRVLINSGHRSVTGSEIAMQDSGPGAWEREGGVNVPIGAMFEQTPDFPITLEEGAYLTLRYLKCWQKTLRRTLLLRFRSLI